MSRLLKPFGAAVALVLLFVGGLYGFRALTSGQTVTPEGYPLLTPMPATDGFEPKKLPRAPVLQNQDAQAMSIDFGYKVGGVAYSYALALAFPQNDDAGRATLTVRHADREASVETNAVRRWDAPRQAYAVALQGKFMISPAVPALCIKAVIGPQAKSYDLADASICIAQRDAGSNCHPETLACGLIRP